MSIETRARFGDLCRADAHPGPLLILDAQGTRLDAVPLDAPMTSFFRCGGIRQAVTGGGVRCVFRRGFRVVCTGGKEERCEQENGEKSLHDIVPFVHIAE